jgi:uncharacterized protein HemY
MFFNCIQRILLLKNYTQLDTMLSFLFFIILFIILIALILLFMVFGFIRSIFGFGRSKVTRNDERTNTYTQPHVKNKIFDKKEGEYVDYEEIK